MPSVMVLVLGADASLANVADAVAAGAKQVRFTEVTVRALVPDVFRFRPLGDDVSLASCDGVVLVAPDDATTVVPDEVTRLGRDGARVETVMACVGGNASLVAAMVATGGIVVSAPANAHDRATATGARVAKVAGWVRHALGHEADAGHHHHEHKREHSHEKDDHKHGHSHDHGHRH